MDYTGFNDKNNNKLYVGNIVRYSLGTRQQWTRQDPDY